MDGRTDGRTERPSYGDAWTHLKISYNFESRTYSLVYLTKTGISGVPVIQQFPENFPTMKKGIGFVKVIIATVAGDF